MSAQQRSSSVDTRQSDRKFTTAPLDYSALVSLETHTEEIRWSPDTGEEVSTGCALFTRNGMTQSVRETVAKREDVQLFTLEDVTGSAEE